MSTANEGAQLVSVPQWFFHLFVQIAGGFLIFGPMILAFSVFAFLIVPTYFHNSVVFMQLAVIGVVIPMLGFPLSEDDEKLLQQFINRMEKMSGQEVIFYTASLVLLLISGLSVEIGVIGILGSLLSGTPQFGLLGLAIAIWYPGIDVWLGRRFGWNLASTGALIGLGLLTVVAILQRSSPTIARDAALDLRESVLAH